jgi:hypothetical protein
MSEAEQVQEEAPMSFEDKFLGVKHQVVKSVQEKLEEQNQQKETNSDLEIEVVDDRAPEDRRPPRSQNTKDDDDEELSGYSDKVKKRINKLKYDFHEERRAKEDAERLREEAVKYAQQVNSQNQHFQTVINQGEGVLVNQIKERAGLSVEQAKSQYREAYEAGETEKVIAAQEALIKAQAELTEAERQQAAVQSRYQQQEEYMRQQVQRPQQPAQAQPPPPQQKPAEPTVKARQWAEDNPWFGDDKHKDMTALAYGVHARIVKDEGFDPNSDEYFEAIDTTMRSKFPEYFDGGSGNSQNTSSTSRRTNTVVAPSTRSNGARPRKVKLTGRQVHLAKRLGLTNEQYARQVEKDAIL